MIASRSRLKHSGNETMKFYRIAIASIAVLLALPLRPVVSQEAVEKESTPSSEETPAVEIPKS
ncbi:MAG TPA: hypothetical protein DIT76_02750, partial [Spartobacteria bacterium]|nr:hypothetical protein [Spartobacteria bacterium]